MTPRFSAYLALMCIAFAVSRADAIWCYTSPYPGCIPWIFCLDADACYYNRRTLFSNCIDRQQCNTARKADPYVCCCDGDLCNDKYCVNSAASSPTNVSFSSCFIAIGVVVFNKLAL